MESSKANPGENVNLVEKEKLDENKEVELKNVIYGKVSSSAVIPDLGKNLGTIKVNRPQSSISRLSTIDLITKTAPSFPHQLGKVPDYLQRLKNNSKTSNLTQSLSRPSTKNSDNMITKRHRPLTSSLISKPFPDISVDTPSFSHKLGTIPSYLKKDPEIEMMKKFLEAKKKLDGDKDKLKTLQQSIRKRHNECKEIAEKAPNKVKFEEDLEIDSARPTEIFETIKRECLETLTSFLDDLKKQLQEGGDQNVEILMKGDYLDNFEKRMLELNEQFQQKLQSSFEQFSTHNLQTDSIETLKGDTTEDLQKEIEEFKQKLKQEEQKSKENLNKFKDQSKQMKVLKEKFEESESKVLELTESLKQKEVDIKTLKSKIKINSENYKQLEALLKDLEETKNANRSDEKEYQKEVQILKQTSEKQVKKLKEEVEELRKNLGLKEGELKEDKKLVGRLQQSFSVKEQEVEVLKNAISKIKQNHLENQPNFSELQEICEEKQNEIQDLQNKIQELEKKLSNTSATPQISNQEELPKYSIRIKQLESKEIEYKNTIKNLQRNLENEIYEKNSKQGVFVLRGALIGVLQEKVAAYENRLESLEVRLKNSYKNLQTLQSQN